tara:strand:+ start:3347 stop:3922 length:576 start_codon:yes stop_codon:yes gene_type:complete
MIPIIHRVNSIEKLNTLSEDVGVEIDIRHGGEKLVLSHDIQEKEENFEEYLDNYNKKFIVANIKESGVEDAVENILTKRKIDNFFLLDVEFPYILQNYKRLGDNLSVRYSKYESIESVSNFANKVKWLWIDTYEDFEINDEIAEIISSFKIFLVSPSRWGMPEKLSYYISLFKDYKIELDGIMIEDGEKIG